MPDKVTQENPLTEQPVSIIGICSDAQSSFMRGAAEAPAKIRAALHSPASNLFTESGLDLENHPKLFDVGDRQIDDSEADFMAIEQHVLEVLQKNHRPLILGGDHAITWPVLRAIAQKHGPVDILHFDAHPDLYDALDGNRFSHACPFARIMEEKLANRLVQVGLRTCTQHQREQAKRFGVEMFEMAGWQTKTFVPGFNRPVYLSLDLDVLDPAFVPGVSHHEPGGFSVRELLTIIQGLEVQLVGADIVEYNPRRNVNGQTATVAAKLLKELLALMLA